jgi:hypothetical protein
MVARYLYYLRHFVNKNLSSKVWIISRFTSFPIYHTYTCYLQGGLKGDITIYKNSMGITKLNVIPLTDPERGTETNPSNPFS